MMSKEKLKLIFKDNKNDKYGLIIKEKENITEKLLKEEFQNQYGFDQEIIELRADGKIITQESYDKLSTQNLIIFNIQHKRIIKSNIKRKKYKDEQKDENTINITDEIKKSEYSNDIIDNKNEDNDNLNINDISKKNVPEKNFSIFNDISSINANEKFFDDNSIDGNSFFDEELKNYNKLYK